MDAPNEFNSEDSTVAPPAVVESAEESCDDRVDSSLLCRGCGYELRGLGIDRNCPECGKAIVESMHSDTLAYASIAWLWRMSQGCRCMVLGLSVVVVATVANYLSQTLIPATAIFHITGLMICAGGILASIGGWLVTTFEPGTSFQRKLSARRIARIGMVLNALTQFTRWVMPLFPNAFLLGGNIWWGVMLMSITLLWGVVWPAYYFYFSRIIRRVPAGRIATQFRIFMVGYILAAVICLASYLYVVSVGFTFTTGSPPPLFWIASLGSFASWGLVIVLQGWSAVLHSLLGRKLRALSNRRNNPAPADLR